MGYVIEDPQSRLLAREKSLGMFIPPRGALRGKQCMPETCFVSWEVLGWKLQSGPRCARTSPQIGIEVPKVQWEMPMLG